MLFIHQICYIQVGNKSDKQLKRVVSHEKGQELAANYNITFMETSAKTGENVKSVSTLFQ